MKIATWNTERLRHKNKLYEVIANCERAAADILVLTETDTRINPSYKSCFTTLPLEDAVYYKETERRVSIFTNYDLVKQYATFDEHTAICVELETSVGNLLVYGTIIGIYGNRNKNFSEDLTFITEDVARLVKSGKPLCVCGDYNMTFSDNYYFTKSGRAALEEMFTSNDLSLLTRNRPECIDHIALSMEFVGDRSTSVSEWNLDKKLSDHKGVVVDLK